MTPMRQIKRAKPIQQIKTSVVYVVHHLSKYTNRRYAEMINLMQGGFVKGAPDIIIAGHPMFLCEMKSKSKSSRIAKEQTEFLERADKKGCFCCVAYGWKSAMQAVEDWIKENPS